MKEELYKYLKEALIDGLDEIKNTLVINENDSLFWFFKNHKKYPVLRSSEDSMPSFYLSDYEKRDYSAVFIEKERYLSIPSWKRYNEWIITSPILCRRLLLADHGKKFTKDLKEIFHRRHSYIFLSDFVDCYIHRYSLEFNEYNFNAIFERYYNFLTFDSLPIEIIIPIIFLPFDLESFALSDNIYIEKIDFTTQVSRNIRTSFTNPVHLSVIEAASHALVLKNWVIPNSDIFQVDSILADINGFKEVIDIANQFFAGLRIAVPNVNTGFAQIISRPIGWEFAFHADIHQSFVISERNYPSHFDNYGWRNKGPQITAADLEKIKTCFTVLMKSSYLNLASNRLNKACLNSRQDDAIIDIAIALESLLTNDSKSEITYRLATRASLLCKKLSFKNYKPDKIFELCKKVYDFRSSIVHGDKKRQEKQKVIRLIEDEEIPVIEISIEFLKHLMWVLITNQDIKETKHIDKLLFE